MPLQLLWRSFLAGYAFRFHREREWTAWYPPGGACYFVGTCDHRKEGILGEAHPISGSSLATCPGSASNVARRYYENTLAESTSTMTSVRFWKRFVSVSRCGTHYDP